MWEEANHCVAFEYVLETFPLDRDERLQPAPRHAVDEGQGGLHQQVHAAHDGRHARRRRRRTAKKISSATSSRRTS